MAAKTKRPSKRNGVFDDVLYTDPDSIESLVQLGNAEEKDLVNILKTKDKRTPQGTARKVMAALALGAWGSERAFDTLNEVIYNERRGTLVRAALRGMILAAEKIDEEEVARTAEKILWECHRREKWSKKTRRVAAEVAGILLKRAAEKPSSSRSLSEESSLKLILVGLGAENGWRPLAEIAAKATGKEGQKMIDKIKEKRGKEMSELPKPKKFRRQSKGTKTRSRIKR